MPKISVPPLKAAFQPLKAFTAISGGALTDDIFQVYKV